MSGPFGATNASGAANDNPYQFIGRELDPMTGGALYYMRARYLDTGMGRFVTRDPQGLLGSNFLAMYSYANNNPLAGMDPTGKFTAFSGLSAIGNFSTGDMAGGGEFAIVAAADAAANASTGSGTASGSASSQGGVSTGPTGTGSVASSPTGFVNASLSVFDGGPSNPNNAFGLSDGATNGIGCFGRALLGAVGTGVLTGLAGAEYGVLAGPEGSAAGALLGGVMGFGGSIVVAVPSCFGGSGIVIPAPMGAGPVMTTPVGP